MHPHSPTAGPRAWLFARRAPALAFGLVLVLVCGLLAYFLLLSHEQTGRVAEEAVDNDATVRETYEINHRGAKMIVSDVRTVAGNARFAFTGDAEIVRARDQRL